MSDRVTNAEVEDVLSSIRRLVSEDNRAGVTRRVAQPSAEPRPDRLVLTPALRVSDPETSVPAATDEILANFTTTDAPNPSDAPDSTKVGHSSEEPDHAFETAFDRDDATAEDPYDFEDGSTDTYATAPGRLNAAAFSEASNSAAPKKADTDVEGEDEAVDQIENARPDTQQGIKAAELSSKIAALETAIGKISDTWEPDDPGESDYAGTTLQEMEWEDESAEKSPFQRPVLAPVMRKLDDDDPIEETTSTLQNDRDDPEEKSTVAHSFSSQRKNPLAPFPAETKPEPTLVLTEPELVEDTTDADPLNAEQFGSSSDADETPEHPEADGSRASLQVVAEEEDVVKMFPAEDIVSDNVPEAEDMSFEPEDDETVEEASQTAFEEDATDSSLEPDLYAEDDGEAFAEEDQLLDEAALRDLVGDIVRAELQGALGERITRNVRKLVRREIHRALTAQELD